MFEDVADLLLRLAALVVLKCFKTFIKSPVFCGHGIVFSHHSKWNYGGLCCFDG